ncbi:MAG: hypothetical protein H6732_19535 [Alphaproteobacteria bacterium]|nr:hypothetical protein [Alphaproteobacteria bacterium]
MRRPALLSALALAAACDPVDPTSATPDGLDRAVAVAEASFHGHVVALETRMSREDADAPSMPYTFVTWRVDAPIAGVAADEEVTLRFLGGPTPSGLVLEVSHLPRFALGDEAVVFAHRNGEHACPLVGCARGLVRVTDGGVAHAAVLAAGVDPEVRRGGAVPVGELVAAAVALADALPPAPGIQRLEIDRTYGPTVTDPSTDEVPR